MGAMPLGADGVLYKAITQQTTTLFFFFCINDLSFSVWCFASSQLVFLLFFSSPSSVSERTT